MAFPKKLFGVVVAVLVAFVLDTLRYAGELRILQYHGGEGCVRLTADGVDALEDFAPISDGKKMLATSGIHTYFNGNLFENMTAKVASATRGKLVIFDAKDDVFERVEVKVEEGDRGFHPHGIGWLQSTSTDMHHWAMVVNHRADGDVVSMVHIDEEIFRANIIYNARHELFRGLNDVLAMGDYAFYTTNWMYYPPSHPMNRVEVYGRRPWTNVVYCTVPDGSKGDVDATCREAATGLQMANGIVADSSGEYVFVAESMGKRVHVFRIADDDSLVSVRQIPLNGAPDNLVWDMATSTLFVGSHPRMLVFAIWAANPHNHRFLKAPSQAYRITEALSDAPVVEEIYLGDQLNASAVAGVVGDSLVMGSVHDAGLLSCPYATT